MDPSAPSPSQNLDAVGHITSIDQSAKECSVQWGGGASGTYPTGADGKFYLRKAVAVQPNHGLGDAMIAAPIMSLQGAPEMAGEAAISLSSAPRPQMMECDGSMTANAGVDSGLAHFGLGEDPPRSDHNRIPPTQTNFPTPERL